MPFVHSEFFHGRNATNCQIIAKNYKLHLPTAISITLLNGLLSLSHLHSWPSSESKRNCDTIHAVQT